MYLEITFANDYWRDAEDNMLNKRQLSNAFLNKKKMVTISQKSCEVISMGQCKKNETPVR